MMNFAKVKADPGFVALAILVDRFCVLCRLLFSDRVSRKIGLEIFTRGYCQIGDFLSREECDRIIAELEGKDDFVVNFGNDSRIFGLQYLSTSGRSLILESPLVVSVCRAFCGSNYDTQTLLFGRIKSDAHVKTGSGGGLHRDSFAGQLKALVYLTDVNSDSGPFQYVEQSNTARFIARSLIKFGYRTRFEVASLEKDAVAGKEMIEFEGKAGTLIFADTRGLHKGRAVLKGQRCAATGYFISRLYSTELNEIKALDAATKAKASNI